LDLSSAPPLLGYVAARAHPGAELLLASDRGEPILARWRVGIGQVAAWTSDVKNRWAAELLGWSGGPRLLVQLARATMRARVEAAIEKGGGKRGEVGAATSTVEVEDAGDGRLRASVEVLGKDERFVDGLAGFVEVEAPAGEAGAGAPRRATLRQTAPGRYEAELESREPGADCGAYLVRSTLADPVSGAVVSTGNASVALPWPREYLGLPTNRALLKEAAALAGGRVDPTPAQIVDHATDGVEARQDLRAPVLLVAVALLLLDVLLRRSSLAAPPPRRLR
jgi:hypothetical protein